MGLNKIWTKGCVRQPRQKRGRNISSRCTPTQVGLAGGNLPTKCVGQPAWRHSDGIPKRKVCFTQNQPRGDAFLWRPHYPPSSHISLCQRHKRYERSSSHHRDPAQAWRYPNCSISSSPNPVSNVLLPILVQLLKANARLGKLYVCLHTKINAKPRPKSKARQLMAGRISRVSTFMNIRASKLVRIKFFDFL